MLNLVSVYFVYKLTILEIVILISYPIFVLLQWYSFILTVIKINHLYTEYDKYMNMQHITKTNHK